MAGKMTKGAAKVSGAGGSAPKGGKQPQQKKPLADSPKAKKVSKGAPAKGGGSDTSPYSSARSSLK